MNVQHSRANGNTIPQRDAEQDFASLPESQAGARRRQDNSSLHVIPANAVAPRDGIHREATLDRAHGRNLAWARRCILANSSPHLIPASAAAVATRARIPGQARDDRPARQIAARNAAAPGTNARHRFAGGPRSPPPIAAIDGKNRPRRPQSEPYADVSRVYRFRIRSGRIGSAKTWRCTARRTRRQRSARGNPHNGNPARCRVRAFPPRPHLAGRIWLEQFE